MNLASHKSEKSEFAYEKVQAYSEIVMGFISFMGIISDHHTWRLSGA